jgi:hypothetical protein
MPDRNPTIYIMFWMRAYPLLRQVGGVGPWKSRVFWAQNGTRPSARCHFTGPQKNFRIPGLNPGPRNGYARI